MGKERNAKAAMILIGGRERLDRKALRQQRLPTLRAIVEIPHNETRFLFLSL
jgi:hypothetical protein